MSNILHYLPNYFLGSFLFLRRSTDLTERFEKRRKYIDLIVDLIRGFPSLDNSKVEQILELSLGRLQAETRLIHDLSLIKGPASLRNEKFKNSGPRNRAKKSRQNLVGI